MSSPSAAQATRLRRPSWRDARLLVGVLLVLLSVLTGAWVIAAADDTTGVYAATGPLLPGQEVRESDVTVVSVHLDETAAAYTDASGGLRPGTYALRAVAEGELIPAAALGSAREAQDKTVAVPLDPAASASLKVGAIVDVWVSRRDPDQAGVRYLDPELLLERAVVAEVPRAARGLDVGVGRAPVSLVVPASEVSAVISSVDQEARITLVPAPGQGGGEGS
ncbi:MAG TPA: SAF domain-containing protein [Ornithinimicrobium sp.]|uniref:SAF domain-containing protein n=1 Tax=Ornithinimicrobium sp. TaxID=1977084 RepID=UPI002B473E4B|nr:SAF domain-containing protein [Ornithinimicrobium sp.]HKJ12589.1 SAF domain-containing protein [Ornithinimicrobium sp.]